MTPLKFEGLYKMNQSDFLASVADKSYKTKYKNSLLNVAKSLDELDQEFVKMAQRLAPIGNKSNRYTLNTGFSPTKALAIGEKRFKDALKQHTKLTGIKLDDIVKRVFKSDSISTNHDSSISFETSKLKFKSSVDEINFFKKVNQIKDDDSLLGHYLQSKERTLKTSILYANFGKDPVKTINKALDNSLKSTLKNIKDSDKRARLISQSKEVGKTFESYVKSFKEMLMSIIIHWLKLLIYYLIQYLAC